MDLLCGLRLSSPTSLVFCWLKSPPFKTDITGCLRAALFGGRSKDLGTLLLRNRFLALLLTSCVVFSKLIVLAVPLFCRFPFCKVALVTALKVAREQAVRAS